MTKTSNKAEFLEPWKHTWRVGFLPSLTTLGLETLLESLREDSPKLLQGVTTSPPPLQSLQDWPVEGGDPIVIAFTEGEERTVGECEEFFARACFEADTLLGEPAGCRHLLNWWDENPRPQVRKELTNEVEYNLINHYLLESDCPLSTDSPKYIIADWFEEHGFDIVASKLRLMVAFTVKASKYLATKHTLETVKGK